MAATASWNLFEAIQRCSEVLACEAFVAHRALSNCNTPINMRSVYDSLFGSCHPTHDERPSTSDELVSIAQELTSSTWLSIIQSSLERPLKKSI